MSSQTIPPVFSPVETESTVGLREVEFSNNGCCFWLPCFKSRSDETIWERISTENQENGVFEKGLNALKKVREWSELVAGPKWKTFIRRFNKNKCSKSGKFQYDPLSYAMNFDEGLGGQETHFVDEDDRLFRGFSARYAASTKGMGCGKEAAPPPVLI